jgi:hypothetical protein
MGADRRTSILSVAVLALMLATLGAPAAAQTSDREDVLGAIRTEAERLAALLGQVRALALVNEHLEVLERARSRALGGRIPPAYLESLVADLTLLQRARVELTSGHRDDALAAVEEVMADLALKRRHAEAGVGFSAGGLRTVSVAVRTVRGAREMHGHFVWFVPRGWSSVRQRFARFDRVSSPTSAVLAPGNYLMWAGDADRHERQPIVVGGHGRREQSIDLPAP